MPKPIIAAIKSCDLTSNGEPIHIVQEVNRCKHQHGEVFVEAVHRHHPHLLQITTQHYHHTKKTAPPTKHNKKRPTPYFSILLTFNLCVHVV